MKYSYLGVAILGICTWLYLSFFPGAVLTSNDKLVQGDYINSSPFLVFGLLFLIPFFLIKGVFIKIEFTKKSIRFRKKGVVVEYAWSNIEMLSMKKAMFSGIYKIKFSNDSNIYSFSSGRKAWSLPFAPIDSTELGEFIDNQKVQHKIPD